MKNNTDSQPFRWFRISNSIPVCISNPKPFPLYLPISHLLLNFVFLSILHFPWKNKIVFFNCIIWLCSILILGRSGTQCVAMAAELLSLYCGAHLVESSCTEGGIRGVRKPQNRTEIRQKTVNHIGFFPKYRNRTYREAHYMYMKVDVTKRGDLRVSFAAFANIFISAGTEIINIRAKLNLSSGKGTSMTCSPREMQKERKLTSSL